MGYREEIISMYNSEEYQRLKQYYAKRSMMDIFGTARSEIAHSNMLGWILDPNETHGLGLFPARKLLHLIAMSKLQLKVNEKLRDRSTREDWDLLDMVLTDGCEICEANVELEKAVDTTNDGKKDSRIDILVELELKVKGSVGAGKVLPIVIENKVGSGEHDNQTQSYYNWAMMKYKGEAYYHPLFVFLTSEGTIKLNDEHAKIMECSCEEYIRVNYQYLVDHLIEPCLKQDVGEDVRRVLKDYLRSLTYTYIKGDEIEGGYCMAVGGEEKQLLIKFWQNNNNLLGAILSAISQCQEIDIPDEMRTEVEKLGNKIAKRDYTKYLVEGCEKQKPLPKNRTVLAVVKEYCKRNPDISYESLRKVFPDSLQGSFGVIRTADDRSKDIANPNAHYFCDQKDKIVLKDGAEVFVSSEWSKGNIERFLPAASKLGIEVSVAQ